MSEKVVQVRVRCDDAMFVEAVKTSNTYGEISAKTGQKLSTTMARYKRLKQSLSEQGIEIRPMQRSKPAKNLNKAVSLAELYTKVVNS